MVSCWVQSLARMRWLPYCILSVLVNWQTVRWKPNKMKLITGKRLILTSAQTFGIRQPFMHSGYVLPTQTLVAVQHQTTPLERGKNRDQHSFTKAGGSPAGCHSMHTYGDIRRWSCQVCIQVWKQVTFSSFSLFPLTPHFLGKKSLPSLTFSLCYTTQWYFRERRNNHIGCNNQLQP